MTDQDDRTEWYIKAFITAFACAAFAAAMMDSRDDEPLPEPPAVEKAIQIPVPERVPR
ncbi:MAG TPA: hypothetical protein VIF12_01090 [Micavibrio sp.]|jgi:hypothetical protein